MNLQLSGKHALVCGASQGIGRAAAIELAQLGADVTLLARGSESLQRALDELPRVDAAQKHGFIAADMNAHAALRAQVKAVANASAVNILVNNSGGPPGGSAHAAALDDFRIAFNQHLIAAQIILQAILPGMQASGYGRIINVISTSVKEPIRNLGVSNTVRGAVASWAKTLATELGSHGITVNNVLPGYTATGRLDEIIQKRAAASNMEAEAVAEQFKAHVPLRRFAAPSEVAAAVAFLASPAAGYIHGINLPVDGGRTRSL
jgi:3-oxoacyl-[acyl-carrier protein] reductase